MGDIMKEYIAGLIRSPYGRKFEWQLETNVDMLSCEAYEVVRIKAKNKQEAVNELIKMFPKYETKTRPFCWGNGWW